MVIAARPESSEAAQRWDEFRTALATLPQPEHVPTRDTYDREIALRLAFEPRCRENWDQWQASKGRVAQTDILPVRLDIENISRCNFRCGMCQVSEWPKMKRAGDMSLDTFQRLIDEQVGLVEIKLHGFGEPTLGGDDFVAMVKYARDRHIWVRTVTNASRLHVGDMYAKLIDAGINEIQISMHGADAETFEAVTRSKTFDTVCDNSLRLNRYCRERNLVRTKMWTVVQRANQHSLPTLVELAARLEFPTMVYSLDVNDFAQEGWTERNSAISVGSDFDIDEAWRMVERGKELGVKVAFWPMASVYSTTSIERLCPWPFERSYIGSDSRVVPCCMIANPDIYEIGSSPAASLTERWRGPEYTEFRRAHLEGRIPDICKGCYGG